MRYPMILRFINTPLFLSTDRIQLGQKFHLLRNALKTFPFSVDALTHWASLYRTGTNKDYAKAETTARLALRAVDIGWPGLKDEPTLS